MCRVTAELQTNEDATCLVVTTGDPTDQATELRTEYALEVCPSVVCHCRDMTMVEISTSAGDGAGSAGTPPDPAFLLDPFERSVVPMGSLPPPPGRPSADAIAAAISPGDWGSLAGAFFAAKARAFAATDFATESAPFPFEEVERDGQLVPIREVIPFAPSFTPPDHDGGEFLIHEQYCVLPRCDCTSSVVGLSVLDPADASAPQRRAESSVDFLVDWQHGTWQIAGDTRPPTAAESALRDRVLAANPNLLDELRRRHEIMRKLYAASAASRRDARPTPYRAAPHIGRNEPCPCGSGKKYKRCCLTRTGSAGS